MALKLQICLLFVVLVASFGVDSREIKRGKLQLQVFTSAQLPMLELQNTFDIPPSSSPIRGCDQRSHWQQNAIDWLPEW